MDSTKLHEWRKWFNLIREHTTMFYSEEEGEKNSRQDKTSSFKSLNYETI